MSKTDYLIEFDLAGQHATGVIAVTVDPGDTAHDAVIAVHNGYREQVAANSNGGRYYSTSMDGVALRFYVDAYGRVSVL